MKLAVLDTSALRAMSGSEKLWRSQMTLLDPALLNFRISHILTVAFGLSPVRAPL